MSAHSNLPAIEILPIMIGTAGHVDHGKTSLVKRLTAIDTDTHKEEKERGMTIDFGVAPCALPGNRVAGIIDVPGHKDFIRNMVAGASAVDVLMLVVAADDSIMPQTREHLKIVALLGMSRLMVVLTKIDLVDAATLELVTSELSEFLERLGFSDAPMIHVSNLTGEGVEAVRAKLGELAAEVRRESDSRAFRMYVRKAFSMKGFGTVVTGVPISGQIQSGSRLELLPAGRECNVRGVQNYRSEVGIARAHISTAINLRDGDPAEFERGTALVEPGRYKPAVSAIVSFENAGEQPLKRRFQCRFHSGTSAVAARARLLHSSQLEPGERGYAALNFNQPQVLSMGDKFIARNLSVDLTIGGGFVLGAYQERLRIRRDPSAQRIKTAVTAVTENRRFDALCAMSSQPVLSAETVVFGLHVAPGAAQELLKSKEQTGQVVALGEGRWLLPERSAELGTILQGVLRGYHAHNKFTLGMNIKQAAEIVGLPGTAFAKLWKEISSSGQFVQRHEFVALAGFKPQISEREFLLKQQVLERVKAAGTQTIAKGPLQDELSMTAAELKTALKLLVEEKAVTVLSTNLIAQEFMESFEKTMLAIFSRQPTLELKDFRDATDTSRNIAVLILEHFDAKGLTKRQGNARVLVQKSAIHPKSAGI